jgi:hypothetical protein
MNTLRSLDTQVPVYPLKVRNIPEDLNFYLDNYTYFIGTTVNPNYYPEKD